MLNYLYPSHYIRYVQRTHHRKIILGKDSIWTKEESRGVHITNNVGDQRHGGFKSQAGE